MSNVTEATLALVKGNQANKNKDYEDAAQFYLEAILKYRLAIDDDQDNTISTKENLGRAYGNHIANLINNKKHADAIIAVKEAEDGGYPQNDIRISEIYYNLALEQISDIKLDEAIKSLTEAVEKNPLDQDIKKTLLHTHCKFIEYQNNNHGNGESLETAFTDFNKLNPQEKLAYQEYGVLIYSHIGKHLLKNQKFEETKQLLGDAKVLFGDSVISALESLALYEYSIDKKVGITMLVSLLNSGDDSVKDNLSTICLDLDKPELYNTIQTSGANNHFDIGEFGLI